VSGEIDDLFTRDTMEAKLEATGIYVDNVKIN